MAEAPKALFIDSTCKRRPYRRDISSIYRPIYRSISVGFLIETLNVVDISIASAMARLPAFLMIQSTTCKTSLHVESCHHSDHIGDIERSFDEYRWEAGIAGGRRSQIWNFHAILRRCLSRNVRRGCPRREHRKIKRHRFALVDISTTS